MGEMIRMVILFLDFFPENNNGSRTLPAGMVSVAAQYIDQHFPC